MSVVTQSVISWASGELDYWEKLTLERIFAKRGFTEDDLSEILEYALEEIGLNPKRDHKRPNLAFIAQPHEEVAAKKHHIEKIFNLRNVNALPSGQEIRFGQQLTLIYGENGAGKTGYVRPLSCAAFARGEHDVLPDVACKEAVHLIPQADIEVSLDGAKKVVTWVRGQARPAELGGYYVFDGNSMVAHLTGTNPIRLSPLGLGVLTRLVEQTDRVRALLKGRIEHLESDPNNLPALFEGSSSIADKMNDLGADTNIEELRALAQLTEEEIRSIAKLEGQIANLRASNFTTRIAKLEQEIGDLQNLAAAMEKAAALTGEAAEAEVKNLVNEVQLRLGESAEAGIDRLKSDFFRQVGSASWREFVTAAKTLADAEATAVGGYPKVNDPCLLCRQPLSAGAVSLVNRLWEFLESDAEAKLGAARSACRLEITRLETLNFGYFAPDSAVRRLLEKELPTFVHMLEAQVSACGDRRRALIAALRSEGPLTVPPAIQVDRTELHKLIEARKSQIGQLQADDSQARLAKLEAPLRELRHRQLLSRYLAQAEEYVANKKRARAARQKLGTSRRITVEQNDLFERFVTQEYANLFKKTLDRFNSRVKVTVETRGQKGEKVRRIVLSHAPGNYSVDDVLSDGEKRIVAFCDFLTEVAMDQTNIGIILDDPVTSLDSAWKQALAENLIEHAKNRQVVVFTHDLAFLYFIKRAAEDQHVGVTPHWIRVEGTQPGFVYLDNSPTCERDFKHAQRARDCYAKAKGLPPTEQELLLQQGFGCLRSSYEALVIFFVFNDVVRRFEERIGYDQLRKVRVDKALLNEIADRMDKLSRHIAAHLHSDALAGPEPTPADLLREIEQFEQLLKKQRALMSAAD